MSMSKNVWDELREAWRYNTPIYQMSAKANAVYFGLVVGFIALFTLIVLVSVLS